MLGANLNDFIVMGILDSEVEYSKNQYFCASKTVNVNLSVYFCIPIEKVKYW